MTINNQLDETEQSELLATGSAINDLSDSSTLNRSEFDMNNIYLTSQKILSEDNDTDTSDNIESLMEKAMTFRYQKPSMCDTCDTVCYEWLCCLIFFAVIFSIVIFCAIWIIIQNR